MSFILNALRKSEQERQALQPENVTDKILLPRPQQGRSKATKLLVFLFIANVLVISGIVWYVRNNLMSTPGTDTPAVAPRLAQDTKPEPEVIAEPAQPEKPVQNAQSDITSIAELIDKEKTAQAPLPVKPVVAKKTPAEAVKQVAITDNPEPQIQNALAIAPAVKTQADTPEAIAVTSDTPYLSDLPAGFRQKVPKFTINVFVYSQSPEERFVMVDMVKYKPGQQIKDAMLLKEILPDGFVVEYQNQAFKIKRP
ncbi:MAG TPA: general secretion pathway protein GspB [Methylobacter sp.]|jgi:general secretion pathway protein B